MDKNPLVLLELVERLANLMRAEMRKAGSEESLQPVHLHALVYLSKANRYSNTPQALAAYLGLTKGTVSQTLLILDRRGLIERYQDDVDRRVVRLRLSTAGEQLLYEAAALVVGGGGLVLAHDMDLGLVDRLQAFQGEA